MSDNPAAYYMSLPEHVRCGTICIFHEWVGRPMDNIEHPVAATWEGGCLRIEFDGHRVLEVWDPAEIV